MPIEKVAEIKLIERLSQAMKTREIHGNEAKPAVTS